MDTIKIATFNVNGIGTREAHLLEWLEKEQPDIACLQELKAVDQKFPALALRRVGYEAIHHGQQSWNGVAILAKGEKPREIRRVGVLGAGLMGAGIATAHARSGIPATMVDIDESRGLARSILRLRETIAR